MFDTFGWSIALNQQFPAWGILNSTRGHNMNISGCKKITDNKKQNKNKILPHKIRFICWTVLDFFLTIH